MPRLNGIQAVNKIKQFIAEMNEKSEKKIQQPKFVFLTAYKTTQFEIHARNLGVSSVHEKPLTLEKLESIFFTRE